MQVEHIVWEEPYAMDFEDFLSVGTAFWEINIRNKGEYEDNFVIVYGRFFKSMSRDNFCAHSLSGYTYHNVEPFMVKRYGNIC